MSNSIAVILGSSFAHHQLETKLELTPLDVETVWGGSRGEEVGALHAGISCSGAAVGVG